MIDPNQTLRYVERAANRYDQSNLLMRHCSTRMFDMLDCFRIQPHLIADCGCATGSDLPLLTQRYPDAHCLGIDFSPAMLKQAQKHIPAKNWIQRYWRKNPLHLIQVDISTLPLRQDSLDIVWSNLTLPLLKDIRLFIQEAYRSLKQEGVFIFSSLGPDTLKQLRLAFPDTEDHVYPFIDMHDIGDILVNSGFEAPVVEMQMLTIDYPDVQTLLNDLRGTGCQNALKNRKLGLGGQKMWQTVRSRLEQLKQDQGIPISFELILAHAWKGQRKHLADGQQIIQFQRRPS